MRRTPSGPAPSRLAPPRRETWSPWRAVFAFGLVSLAADMVYEGMRATAGPLLGSLGASALTVGVITGAGEAVALVLRLVTGAWADDRRQYWRLTFLGYGMTAVCVPLLAVTPFLGGAGLAVAAALILLERTGKAVRSPAKSALLARMAASTGRGKGFGVHKALDQVGSIAGPLLMAGVTLATGLLWPGFVLLAVPGAVAMLLLLQLRRRAPDQPAGEPTEPPAAGARSRVALGAVRAAFGTDLPPGFRLFALSAALTTTGLMTFGVISFRLVEDGIVSAGAVPVVYAAAMAVQAVAALAFGALFDRRGGRVLLVVPAAVAAVPVLVFADRLWLVVAGMASWGAATGIQDSTVKAFLADLVPARRLATAYGVFAAVQGVGALVGGVLAGALVEHHVDRLVVVIAVLQLIALAVLLRVTGQRTSRR